ncbi:MAG: serine/threonine protein kinase [Labilithrix sp.]|nr:serine/threonine protein kinase [Labilithrix sp.]
MDASAVPSKVCAACGGRYPGDALFCPTDGTPLQSAAAAEREASDPYLGQEISGHIEIRQLVGVGAMGRVYRAFQRGIDRDVAVKILHRELSANAQLVSRFTREAKVASRLQHPNVVQVLLAGQLPDRALYMVMEYLDGLSLQSALAAAGGALPLDRALHIALQLCDATGEAHAQGIVHRDLKPENVMLVRRGSDPDCVKVLDFGIARINWGEQSVATAAGLIFGTARYISPEGAQGNAVGPASDVYSIGTLLFQMLSGRTPFDGDQAVGLLVQQIHDPAPQLRSIPRAAHVPEPIAEVVMASLAKDPARREPDARAFGQAIFDAARLAGLSPEEFSRPMLKRQPPAMKLPPVERTKQLELTPDVVQRMSPEPAKANGSHGAIETGQRAPTAATVKWEPPSEFQARLAEATRTPSAPSIGNDRPSGVMDAGSRPRLPSGVDETIDDMTFDAQRAFFPTPTTPPTVIPKHDPGPVTPIPRTVPGDVEGPVRTHYTPPMADVVTSAPRVQPSSPEMARLSSHPPVLHEEKRPRAWLLVVLCFVLGAAIALGWAWKVGKIGPGDADEERFVARATDAMFKNHFHEPPGDNVKEITDEGLRRWPNDRKLLDIRVRAANELISQAIAQRSAGDVVEALKLAKIAHDLDPHDASAKRLVEQYEAELAAFSPSAAPTLAKPPERPPTPGPTPKPSVPGPTPTPAPTREPPQPQPSRIDYKALVDVSAATPRLGQTVELTARIAPNKGDFDAPGFTIVGPGVPGGVRMPAQTPAPGIFKASYAFLEAGRFEITFTTQEGGRTISAKRSVIASAMTPPAPTPTPTPSPTPTPTGSVKWM